MNVTESRFKNRQLHIEDYLQMVSAEQKEYAEVFDYSKITEKSGVITDYWTNNLLDLILRKDNLNSAYKQVKKNKGKGGIDGMQVDNSVNNSWNSQLSELAFCFLWYFYPANGICGTERVCRSVRLL